MNNNFNLKQYLSEGKLLSEIEVGKGNYQLQQLFDKVIEDDRESFQEFPIEDPELSDNYEYYVQNAKYGTIEELAESLYDTWVALNSYNDDSDYGDFIVYIIRVCKELNFKNTKDLVRALVNVNYSDAYSEEEFDQFEDDLEGLNEIEVGLPGAVIKVTNKPYKALNPELNKYLIDLIYDIEENNGRSEVFNEPLKDVIEDLRNDSNLLYSGIITPNDIVYKTKVLTDILSEDENDFHLDDIQILVDLYNNNDDQGLIDYFVSKYGLTQFEDHFLMDESTTEVYTDYNIKQDIKNHFIPFISAYNELGDSYTIISGDYANEEYLVETDDESIIYKESLFNSDFDTSLSTFDKRGNLVVKGDIERENPMVF